MGILRVVWTNGQVEVLSLPLLGEWIVSLGFGG